jgi:hypothetical protein
LKLQRVRKETKVSLAQSEVTASAVTRESQASLGESASPEDKAMTEKKVLPETMEKRATRGKTGILDRKVPKEATGLVCACESSGRTPSTYQAIMYLPSPQTATITQCSLQRKPSLRKKYRPKTWEIGMSLKLLKGNRGTRGKKAMRGRAEKVFEVARVPPDPVEKTGNTEKMEVLGKMVALAGPWTLTTILQDALWKSARVIARTGGT